MGSESRHKGLIMSGKGKGLTAGTDSSYGMGHDPEEQVEQVDSVEDDVHE
jgi:hypothetical protein